MSVIKKSNLGITKASLRSDEAGCYHNSRFIASLRDIGDIQGIEIVRLNHSQPLHGKDLCNRILIFLRNDWVWRFQNISLDGKQQTQHKSKVKSATEDGKMEGAMHKPQGGQTRFTDKV